MNKYVVYLEWPEQCFRVNAEALGYLETLVPAGSEIVRVKDDTEFLRELADATHAIVWHFDPKWFELAPRLKLLATPSAGRELLPKTGPKGVTIHFGGFHGAAISESVLGYMLAWCRGVLRRPGKKLWERTELGDKCYTLSGTRAVILGYGRIGKAIGEKLALLGVETVGITRGNIDSLAAEAARADWLIAALPSDTGTDNLVDEKTIASLPKRAVFINVGRGNSVDEAALRRALEEGRLAGAILDVLKREPPQPGDTLADPQIPNLTVMSHSAAFYPGYVRDCFKELAQAGLLA